MFGEFRLHTFAGDSRRRDGMHGIAQHADDFRRQHRLQNVDRAARVAPITRGHIAPLEMAAGAVAQGLDVGQEWLGGSGILGHDPLRG